MDERQAITLLQKIAAHRKHASDVDEAIEQFRARQKTLGNLPNKPYKAARDTLSDAYKTVSDGLRGIGNSAARSAGSAVSRISNVANNAVNNSVSTIRSVGSGLNSDKYLPSAKSVDVVNRMAHDAAVKARKAISNETTRDIALALIAGSMLGLPLAGMAAWRRVQQPKRKLQSLQASEYDLPIPYAKAANALPATKHQQLFYTAAIPTAAILGGYGAYSAGSKMFDSLFKATREREVERKRKALKDEIIRLYATPTAAKSASVYAAVEKCALLSLNNQYTRFGLGLAVPASLIGFLQQYKQTRKDDPAKLIDRALRRRAARREQQRPSDLYAQLEHVELPPPSIEQD